MKKKALNTDFEVYNYLNITNRKLSKLYKYYGYTFLPDDYNITKESFKERLLLNEMQKADVFPPFEFEDKKAAKKRFKESIKRLKEAIKHGYAQSYGKEFATKVEIYLYMRLALTKILLKDFAAQETDEVGVYQEIYNLNPVFGELLDDIYLDGCHVKDLFAGLEERYQKSYLEKLKKIEKKTNKKQQERQVLEDLQNIANKEKSTKISEKSAKNVEKTVKNTKKVQKSSEVKQVKEENKKAKQKVRENA